ncbi:unnamed protein product [Phaeothamnion confervicola]
MDPISLAGEIITLLQAIEALVRGMKDNAARCIRFAERLELLRGPLQEVAAGTLSANEGFLRQVQALFVKAEKQIEKFKRASTVFRALNHKSHAAAFDELNAELTRLAGDQLFCATNDFFQRMETRQQEDRDDERRDREIMQELLEDLVAGQEAHRIEARENHAALVALLDAIRRSAPKDVFQEIPRDNLVLGTKIGEGGFGVVYSATWDHTSVAVKLLRDANTGIADVNELRRELRIHAQLNSKHIVPLYGACTMDPRHLCLVMELATQGSVWDLLHGSRRTEPLSVAMSAAMMYDVAKGMLYLHRLHPPVLHHDLKSLNLLLFDGLVVKICDFGLAKVKQSTMSTARTKGTAAWMPPECFEDEEGESWTCASDVYSFGVVMYEFLARQLPWPKKKEAQIAIAVMAGKRPTLPDGCEPGALRALMERCWDQVPVQRPDFDDVAIALRDAVAELGDPRGLLRPSFSTSASTTSSATSGATSGTVPVAELTSGFSLLSVTTGPTAYVPIPEKDVVHLLEDKARLEDCAAIVELMRAHVLDAHLQERGCTAVLALSAPEGYRGDLSDAPGGYEVALNVAANNDNQRKLGAVGACEAVIAAMRTHSTNAAVQQQGCWAVKSLCRNDDNKRKLVMAGACEAVVAAMRAHSSNAIVQEYACWAVWSLGGDIDNKRKLGSAGTCEAVLAAMRAHSINAAVQKNGCGAVSNLAADADNRRKLGAARACEAVAAAMKAHSTNAAVQEQGCQAVWNLVADAHNKRKLVAAGACEAVAAAMKAHSTNAAVQEYGCWAVCNLASNDADNKRKLGAAGACEAVVAAMRAHRTHSEVQRKGADALTMMG